MSKSAIYLVNNTNPIVTVDSVIPLGSVIRRFGCALALNGNTVTADEVGYYDVNASVTAEPTAAGTVAVTLYNNGVAVPGATASATAAAAGDPVNVSFESLVRVLCHGAPGALTLVLSGAEATVTNVAVVAEKI